MDKVRFVSSGTEAVMSAVRLARGYTGRDLLIKFEGCYHGHVDSLMVSSGSGLATFGIASSPGIPKDTVATTLVAPLDDIEAVEYLFNEHGEDIAAVVIPKPADALIAAFKSPLSVHVDPSHSSVSTLAVAGGVLPPKYIPLV